MSDPLRHNATLVESLGSALRSGDHGLRTVPALLQQILEKGSWCEFVTQRGEHVEHKRFELFVTTPPLKGLGADMVLVERIIKGTPAEAVLDETLRQERPLGVNQHGEGLDNIQTLPPTGTSRARALRKLRKDAPELLEQVLAGDMTPHGAMVTAGFLHRKISVPVDDPQAAARTIRRQFEHDALVQLVAALIEPEGGA